MLNEIHVVLYVHCLDLFCFCVCAFRSYLDMVKLFVFSYFFWLVLCLIFITGTTRINIFCLGYLVACFYFMLFGGTLLLQPVQYVLRLWDCLIAYTCVVISLKNMLSVSALSRPVGWYRDQESLTNGLTNHAVPLCHISHREILSFLPFKGNFYKVNTEDSEMQFLITKF